MKRRGFFASVFALPAAVKAMQEAPVPAPEPLFKVNPEMMNAEGREFMETTICMSATYTCAPLEEEHLIFARRK